MRNLPNSYPQQRHKHLYVTPVLFKHLKQLHWESFGLMQEAKISPDTLTEVTIWAADDTDVISFSDPLSCHSLHRPSVGLTWMNT